MPARRQFQALGTRSPTPDLAFVVRSLRNAAHLPLAAMTADATTTWGVGEYALIAERLEPAAQRSWTWQA